ncbi:MAG: GNAT family N-acetyltransferase [Pseudonocardia sp.]
MTSSARLHVADFEHPDVRWLLNALYAEQLTRYERADEPEEDPTVYQLPEGTFLLLRVRGQPAGCGGYRRRNATTGEIKRMFVYLSHRGQGYGRRILAELEGHAQRRGAQRIILETGVRNQAAIALYESSGYVTIPPYEHGRDTAINRAFAKSLPTLVAMTSGQSCAPQMR